MNDSEMSRSGAGSARQARQLEDDGNGSVSAWSALTDGALGDQEWDALWEGEAQGAAALEDWNAYQIVGDALRGGVPLSAATPPAVFLANFQARLHRELAAGPLAPAAPVPAARLVAGEGRPAEAANDSIFRWKMLAMAASLAAVMAVSWSVLGTVTGDRASQTGIELATATPPATSAEGVVTEPANANTAVIVNTGQGPLIRDARLEALLAEHRQYGGLSALQKPAGFLRNATYDTPDR